MHFIIGGAYQGKQEYARLRFGLKQQDIFFCEEDRNADFSKACISHMENFAYYCIRLGIEPAEELEHRAEEWQQNILICDDIFCGVVPADADARAWREAAGRMACYLSRRAESVTRVFCGLPIKLK
ncbi:hypothetical protein SDC9_178826 [bioreactor metagenome]|uniref:Adenosylcobinamide kinase n=1 Tax=bioreactor metagenome TaxID=1076179 RepID=A0A645GZ72_9ZZZZ